MSLFQKSGTEKAIALWNTRALDSNRIVTIAHNPRLFHFFSEALSLSPFYLILHQKNRLAGLFPVVKAGKQFYSLPHFSGGGILWIANGEKNIDEENLMLLLIAAVDAEKISPGFYHVELSHLIQTPASNSTALEIRSLKPFFETETTEKAVYYIHLKEDEKTQFASFMQNLKRKIKKASKNGIVVRNGNLELLDDFTKVYNRNMHRIGSPTLGKRFFQSLIESSGPNTELFVAYLDDMPVGGAFAMWYDGYFENTWFSTLSRYNSLYPSYLLHWEMIKKAIDRQCKIYSLGRSTVGSGVHQYKKQWPVEEIPLCFSMNTVKKMGIKDQKWASEIWKRLPPFLVDLLGPAIAKRIY